MSNAKPPFIAFYSYKGGVGRTLALANCARALAARGKTVAIIDLDLEAPGLELFDAFRPKGETPTAKDAPRSPLAGFAEYIADCRQDGPPRELTPYFHRCAGREGDRGAVYLMPAGRRGEAAYRDILAFDWDRFYRDEEGYRFMENLRGHIAHNLGGDERQPARPDYVLIDARTGLSETGGIATHQLADLVVLLFNLNRQNLEGIQWVHDSLAKLPNPPGMLLVASPIPVMPTEKGTPFHERMQFVRRRLKRAKNADRPLVIPYRPVLSWEERIFVDDREEEYFDYDTPYRELLNLILKTLDAPEIYLDEAKEAWGENRLAEARMALENGLKAHPGHPDLEEMRARLGGDTAGPRVDLSHLPAGAPHFLGREAELAALDAAWASAGQTAVVEFIAPGGAGKSALVKRWLDGMRAGGWRGAARVFGWSFYSQGTSDDRQASEDPFLTVALRWFGVQVDPTLGPWDKGLRLAEAVAARRTLLILDGIESLQYPPGLGGRGPARAVGLTGGLRAPGLQALLGHLAGAGQPGLCVLSSRERVQELVEWEGGPAPSVRRIDLGDLSDSDGARLLHTLGARLAGKEAIGPDDAELQDASREVRGHALTISLLGGYLALAFEGDIRRRDQVDLADADAEGAGDAFRVVAAYERWFAAAGEAGARQLAALRLLGFFDRPASTASLEALRAEPAIAGLTDELQGLTAAQWRATVKQLEACGLVMLRDGEGGLDAHPLVREYLAATLQARQPAAWQEGHRRIYEQLKASVPQRPEGLAALQPLYQAVAHGCRAGLWQEALDEVYVARILRGTRGDGYYSVRQLSAFGANLGAVACFFAEPWRRPIPAMSPSDQAWLLNEAAFHLRALGRLDEALEPMRAGAEFNEQLGNWWSACIGYDNLSRLLLTLGQVEAAAVDARHAVDHADRSGEAFPRVLLRATLANALHQKGDVAEAQALFAAAESMQAEFRPEYPLLNSEIGFYYCDLLLANAEREERQGREKFTLVAYCEGLARRAQQTLQWSESRGAPLLDLALDHLTLARCALYADRLQGRPPGATARREADLAVTGLRAAGQQDELPRGLLTRARLLHPLGDADSIAQAAADLAEAERIARRGGMRLHLADCQLTRARLFHDRPALAEARRLIEECGYARRLAELEDAEAAAQTWPH